MPDATVVRDPDPSLITTTQLTYALHALGLAIGAFGAAMSALENSGMMDAVLDHAASGKPFLGICLGMQLMSKTSEEAPGEKGLGWFDSEVVRFNVQDKQHFKIPHIGWNQLMIRKENELTKNLSPSAEFYFSHS